MIVECETCNAYVEARDYGHYEKRGDNQKPFSRILLMACSKCFGPLLIEQTNIGNIIEGDVWDTPRRLFPTTKYRPNPNAPKEIQATFEEAYTCLRSRAYTAAAIMCRKTLEGVCKTHGAEKQNLMQSLKKMKEDGLIDERLYEWSNTLRNAGNEAAHDVGVAVSETDATDIIEFTNAILDYLFSFRDRFEKFKLRRISSSN